MIPCSILKKLGITNLEPSNITLHLVDHSVIYPRGVIEDVLVKVDKFIFLVDFVILDIKTNEGVPIILG